MLCWRRDDAFLGGFHAIHRAASDTKGTAARQEPTHTSCVHGTLHAVFDTFHRNLLKAAFSRLQVILVPPPVVCRCISLAELSGFLAKVAWRPHNDKEQQHVEISFEVCIICDYFTPLKISLLCPLLTLSWTQFGSPLSRLALPALLGRQICPPVQLTIRSTIMSATTAGSMISEPWLLSAGSRGPRSGVRTQ